MNNFLKILLISIFFVPYSYSQTITGKILDAETKEPLAFANFIFNNNQKFYTSSDIDGRFSFSSSQELTTLTVTYIGYETQTVKLQKDKNITIYLKASADNLDEVVIKPGENPANAIIRKVIANKEKNNPENISTFKYTSYNKTVYDIKTDGQTKNDSINKKMKGKLLKDSPLFMMESVSERKFIAPDISEEVVIGTKVSGFQNPSFASLATDLQPFSFYKDNIKLFDIQYLNPISKGSLNKYRFTLEDTLFQKNDTIYIISFEPRKNKNIEGLKGSLYINSNKYAVQNVIATPFEKGKIDIKIQQQYTFIDNKYWFPEQLNYALVFTDLGMVVDGKSYISEVQLDIPLRKKEFALESVRIDKMATKQDTLFWDKHRIEKLSEAEKVTYRVVDSIGKENNFDKLLTTMEKLAQFKIGIGVFDLDLAKTLVYNKYEGYRLGLGVYTNEKLFENLTLGGFFGYGLRDYEWKYGAEAIYTLSKENEFKIGAKYQDNLVEAGNYGLNYSMQNMLNFRNFQAYLMDNVKQGSFNVEARSFRYLKWKVTFTQSETTPKYLYEFHENGQVYTDYNDSNIRIDLRFAFKEKLVTSFNQRLSLGTTYPILSVSYSKGIKDVMNSDFNYDKIEARLEQSFFTKNFGATKYRLEAGIIDNPLPYGLLFTGEGSYDKDYPYLIPNYFQTMLPYEFLSDRYANLFLTHNFGGLLFKKGKFQPSVILHNNFGWGDLSEKNATSNQLIAYQTKKKIFMETGLQLDNLVKMNYMDVGYLGIGGGIFYRYGEYANAETKDNLVYKLSLSFSIK
ncbi:hypothetical protein J2X31_001041 [Flavobacterium arsenatis]|uniref:Carboxypeptidase-like regulatory domain-containing protein n=1 Tax=Flavobacterium arsenatis TaxID=1484332 RepID=A0ABU1TM65_9FLAO|nr:DUF5686 family protein [Flavobacterium arsenatis]MDR6967041.1 hypothetical protein [Flavobacterium arsenatis]